MLNLNLRPFWGPDSLSFRPTFWGDQPAGTGRYKYDKLPRTYTSIGVKTPKEDSTSMSIV